MSIRGFLIPPPLNGEQGTVCYKVTVPDTFEWRVMFKSALYLLTRGREWDETTGIVTEAQEVARAIFDSVVMCDEGQGEGSESEQETTIIKTCTGGACNCHLCYTKKLESVIMCMLCDPCNRGFDSSQYPVIPANPSVPPNPQIPTGQEVGTSDNTCKVLSYMFYQLGVAIEAFMTQVWGGSSSFPELLQSVFSSSWFSSSTALIMRVSALIATWGTTGSTEWARQMIELAQWIKSNTKLLAELVLCADNSDGVYELLVEIMVGAVTPLPVWASLFLTEALSALDWSVILDSDDTVLLIPESFDAIYEGCDCTGGGGGGVYTPPSGYLLIPAEVETVIVPSWSDLGNGDQQANGGDATEAVAEFAEPYIDGLTLVPIASRKGYLIEVGSVTKVNGSQGVGLGSSASTGYITQMDNYNLLGGEVIGGHVSGESDLGAWLTSIGVDILDTGAETNLGTVSGGGYRRLQAYSPYTNNEQFMWIIQFRVYWIVEAI